MAFILFLPAPIRCSGREFSSRKAVYSLAAQGVDKGVYTVETTIHDESEPVSVLVRENMELQASFLWKKWTLSSEASSLFDDKGVSRFQCNLRENKDQWMITGVRKDKILLCQVHKTLPCRKSKPADQIDEAGLSKAISGETEEAVNLPLEAFDATEQELSAALLKSRVGQAPLSIKVLSFSDLEIVELKYHAKKMETIQVGERAFPCIIVETESPLERSSSWISQDALGAFLVKEEGRDEYGPYKCFLQEYRLTP